MDAKNVSNSAKVDSERKKMPKVNILPLGTEKIWIETGTAMTPDDGQEAGAGG